MVWTIEEIETGWLGGGRVAVSREDVAAAFERCEQVFGRDWVDAQRPGEKGAIPTLAMVRMGQ